MPSAYIETTIPSYYVARPSMSVIQAARQASTRAWWDGGCSGFWDRLRKAMAELGFELPVMCSPEELLRFDDEDT